MTRKEIVEQLAERYEKPVEEFEKLSNYRLFAKWLQWNGIIGYTDDILDVLETLTGCKFFSKDRL